MNEDLSEGSEGKSRKAKKTVLYYDQRAVILLQKQNKQEKKSSSKKMEPVEDKPFIEELVFHQNTLKTIEDTLELYSKAEDQIYQSYTMDDLKVNFLHILESYQSNHLKSARLKQCTDSFIASLTEELNVFDLSETEKVIKSILLDQVLILEAENSQKTTNKVFLLIEKLNEKIYLNGSVIYCAQNTSSFETCRRYNKRVLLFKPRILLRRLLEDSVLENVNFVILNAINERSIETDVLMALIKKILHFRLNMKLIIITDPKESRSEILASYFNDCPKISVTEQRPEINVLYLDDILYETKFKNFKNLSISKEYKTLISSEWNFIEAKYGEAIGKILLENCCEGCANLNFLEYLIFYISKHKPPGNILVYLPGRRDILELATLLKNSVHQTSIGNKQKLIIKFRDQVKDLPDQKADSNDRIVILTTETNYQSFETDDILYIINPGRFKRSILNDYGDYINYVEMWITKDQNEMRQNQIQRPNGICYNLFTRLREEHFEPHILHNIYCRRLEPFILTLKMLDIPNIVEFFKDLPIPPEESVLEQALDSLKSIQAINSKEQITPLGIFLYLLKIDDVQVAKMLLLGALFKCLDPVTSIAATLLIRSPFNISQIDEKKIMELSGLSYSDHILFHQVVEKYRESVLLGNTDSFCTEYFVNTSVIDQIISKKKILTNILRDIGLVNSSICTDELSNTYAKSISMVRAVIAAALYPNVAVRNDTLNTSKKVKKRTVVKLFNNDISCLQKFSVLQQELLLEQNFLVYSNLLRNTINNATMIDPKALLLFSDDLEFNEDPDGSFFISMGSAYKFPCRKKTGKVIHSLRKALKHLLKTKVHHPVPVSGNSHEAKLLESIQLFLN